jgi:hypothetical protein
MKKTTVFIEDTFYLHVIMVVICFVFIVLRVMPRYNVCFAKINPYLLTYSFRVLFMEWCLGAILFFTYLSLGTTVMRLSLAVLIFDLVLIALSFFWKVRT